MRDTVVIGAGLAGLAATLRLAEEGRSVTLVTKGIGGLQLGQGTVDVLGYRPEYVDQPLRVLPTFVENNPDHPYQHFSASDIKDGFTWIKNTVGENLLMGDGQENFRLPTAVGALRPTALAQPSMVAGVPRDEARYLIVGFRRLKDFYPDLVAANLARQTTASGEPIQARAVHIDLEVRPGEYDTSGLNFARALDRSEVRERLCALLDGVAEAGEVIGFPAVLGVEDLSAWQDIATRLGHEVFEIPLPPPSVPGMRLNERMTRLVKKHARLITGSPVVGYQEEHGRITTILTSSAGREHPIETKHVVLATGGFESGGLVMNSYGKVFESIFDLPLVGTDGELTHGDYWGEEQPLFRAGVRVNRQMIPLTSSGQAVFDNLYATGGLLAGATRWREKSGDAIALLSALRATESILGSK